MNEIPMWWLILSAIFFATNAVLIGALAYAVIKLGKVVTEMRPKIESLVSRVDSVATKVDGLTSSLQSTVHSVGEKAQGVSGAASNMALTTSRVFEKYAPILAIVMAGFKVFTSIQEYRSSHDRSDGRPKSDKAGKKVATH